MESLAANLSEMRRTPLHAAHVGGASPDRHRPTFPAGTIMAEVGDPMDSVYVLQGAIELIDPHTRESYLPNAIGPTQFMGEITFLRRLVADHACPRRGRGHRGAAAAMLEAMARLPEMSDIVITVFAARRRRQLDESDTSLKLIGIDRSRAIRTIADYAARNKMISARLRVVDDPTELAERLSVVWHRRPAEPRAGSRTILAFPPGRAS